MIRDRLSRRPERPLDRQLTGGRIEPRVSSPEAATIASPGCF
jgi:hypothetical protein